ncbi:MAG: hypothetical protein U1F53_20710 [Burkholderiaceae bacterium]
MTELQLVLVFLNMIDAEACEPGLRRAACRRADDADHGLVVNVILALVVEGTLIVGHRCRLVQARPRRSIRGRDEMTSD